MILQTACILKIHPRQCFQAVKASKLKHASQTKISVIQLACENIGSVYKCIHVQTSWSRVGVFLYWNLLDALTAKPILVEISLQLLLSATCDTPEHDS